jgi:hypothetical protein
VTIITLCHFRYQNSNGDVNLQVLGCYWFWDQSVSRVSRNPCNTIEQNYQSFLNDPKLRHFDTIFDDLDRSLKIIGHMFQGFSRKYKVNEKSRKFNFWRSLGCLRQRKLSIGTTWRNLENFVLNHMFYWRELESFKAILWFSLFYHIVWFVNGTFLSYKHTNMSNFAQHHILLIVRYIFSH